MAQATVVIGTDLSSLRRDLAKIPNMTDEASQKMLISLEKSVKSAERASKKATKEIKRQQKQAAKESAKAWAKFSKGLTLTLDVSSVLSAVSTLGDFAQGVADMRNDLADLSVRSGLTSEQIQGLRLAFEGSGQSASDMTRIITKLPGLMSQASMGAKKQEEAFSALGVSVVDMNGELRDADQVFADVLSGLSEIESPTQRAAAATELFGNAGTKLLQALGDPSSLESFVSLAGTAAGVSSDAAEAAADWQRAVAELGVVLEGFQGRLFDAMDLTGILQNFTMGLTFMGTFLQEILGSWLGSVKGFFSAVVALKNGDFSKDLVFMAGLADLPAAFARARDAAHDAALEIYKARKKISGGVASPSLTDTVVVADSEDVATVDALAEAQADLNAEVERYAPDASKMEQILDLMFRLSQAYDGGVVAAEDFNRGMLLLNAALDDEALKERTAALKEKEEALRDAAKAEAEHAAEVERAAQIEADRLEDIQTKAIEQISGAQAGIEGIVTLIGGPVAGAIAGLILNIEDTIAGLEEQLLALPDTLTKIPSLIVGLLDTIIEDFIPELAAALPVLVVELVKAVPQIIKAGIVMIPTLVREIRVALFDAIKEGFKDFASGAMAEAAELWWENLKDGIKQFVEDMWERIKEIFDFGALFGEDGRISEAASKTGDTIREIFTLGTADTATYGDTPGPVRAGVNGLRARFGAGDVVVAARDEDGIRAQVGMGAARGQMMPAPSLDLRDGHIWMERALRRNASGGGTISKIGGDTPGQRSPFRR